MGENADSEQQSFITDIQTIPQDNIESSDDISIEKLGGISWREILVIIFKEYTKKVNISEVVTRVGIGKLVFLCILLLTK